MLKSKAKVHTTDTLIGQGTEMEGLIKCEASMRIEGKFKGEIETLGDVTIGESGTATSNIVARDVIIAGKVFGDVTTKGKLTITRTGHLNGNYFGHTLIIMEGADFNGESKMTKAETHTIHSEPEQANRKQKKQAG